MYQQADIIGQHWHVTDVSVLEYILSEMRRYNFFRHCNEEKYT